MRPSILLLQIPLLGLFLLSAGMAPVRADTPPACPGNPSALGTWRTITIDTSAPLQLGLKTYSHTLDLKDHEVVLTFDDGPVPATTRRVLDALEHDCVRATFFLIGRNAKAAPALVKREIADGDTVGHHTWSHPQITERGLPDDKARADIDRGFAADDLAAYGSADKAPRVPFFRFPGFADTPALVAWLNGRHIAVFGADLWASDWIDQTPEQELALLMGRLNAEGRGIILLHDARRQTAAMVPAFLQALKANGYHVVAIKPGPGPTPIRAAPKGWSSETEKIIANNWPKLMKLGARPFIQPAAATTAAPAPAIPETTPGQR